MGGNSEVQIPDPVAESKGAGVSVSRVPDKVAPAESMKAESKHAERVKVRRTRGWEGGEYIICCLCIWWVQKCIKPGSTA